ncbi:DUF1648 domain-containing protein [Lawsonibacter faecis]|jgi:hypothetical protein|uniref:DUF1648 domain-containing protein n=1 Tax=Lawsonibacter faecis TaxID=2763052 RepID=A0A8J6JJK9_9FIRM|nr:MULTISPECIES: DUF1648 domain-containing protein [Oscillospiraceae]MTQ95376.1 DUF1648 domain-containing protein [Pseudoflavonifractor sp. BIOML-A16]MTR07316.1 DUF1648 domain-containing protein [Pseudoflavonifractor sp. BIOML-A15]MTR32388.1 DUF1648 domain-containing protein [Pseudoflavonifractor sp. BIOML-A14]MTR72740.1 DUF1648 domain-containing protein [Pseudoflavonifractor sp. BIOML-A18]MTS64362.1 DUF1648 domain-containing protein [Pseudoflavonifractor sp. BIOML-A5]MTS70134.1 DUF1648 domai
MRLHKSTFLCIAAVVLTLILAAAAWFLLPDSVGMQLGVSGQVQNFMPKPLALLLPVGLCAVGTGLSFTEERRTAGLILALISPVLVVITIFMNHSF